MNLDVRYDPDSVREATAGQVRAARMILVSMVSGAVLIALIGVLFLEPPARWIVLIVAVLEVPIGLWISAPSALSGTSRGPAWERTPTSGGLAFSADERGLLVPSDHSTQRFTWDQVSVSSSVVRSGGRPGPQCLVVEAEGLRRIYHPSGLTPGLSEVLRETRLLERTG